MLFNATLKKPVIKDVRLASTAWSRLKGLMFESVKDFDYALVFEFPTESRLGAAIHMLFVFFPISAVFLDRNKKVVDTAELKPFTPSYVPKKPAKFLVELPKEKARQIRKGHILQWWACRPLLKQQTN